MGSGAVLVVEDEPLLLMWLEDLLLEAGHSVVIASSAKEATAVLNSPNGISALLTDIRLGPGKTGWWIAQVARRERPEIPVIYISGDAVSEWGKNGVAGSIMMQKPVEDQQLIQTLEGLLD